MPDKLPISINYINFRGQTSSGKAKIYSVCLLCGFEEGKEQIEENILECGRLGSTRASRKYFHLKDNCSKAKELGLDKKYNKEGYEVGSGNGSGNNSNSNGNNSNSNRNASNSNPILKFSFF